MGLFTNSRKGKPPHTWYPDILHWKEGDEIYCWSIISALGWMNFSYADYYKYMDSTSGRTKGTFYYKSVDENGNIFLEDQNGNNVQCEFWRFIKKARNESLKSRQIERQVKESEEYMELMKEFQKAFNELQESDNHPHRLGESINLPDHPSNKKSSEEKETDRFKNRKQERS